MPGVGAGNARAAQRRRDEFLEQLRGGASIAEAMVAVGWRSRDTYLQNRARDTKWAAQVDTISGTHQPMRQPLPRSNDSHHGGPRHRPGKAAQVYGKQEQFIAELERGHTIPEAIARVGWTNDSTYRKSRARDTQFALTVDDILAKRAAGMGQEPPRDDAGRVWTPSDGFGDFRARYLQTDSPWFHLMAIDAMESMGPGSILHILWPPEHGKTRLWEDYYTFLLVTDPAIRLVIGSEKIAQATKIVRFVRDRLEHNSSGYEMMRDHFGPFWPFTTKERRELREAGADDGASGSQAWGVQAFNVRNKPTGIHAERDYSMYALGMGSSIIGTRADKLGVDDPQGAQSHRKKENSAQLVEQFRQDWLTRPGPTGKTYILANRVGAGDFHEVIQETGIVDRTITLPAWDPDSPQDGWLWPGRYTPADYRKMKRNAGEGAWDRNYMQKGLSNKDASFSQERIAKSKNPLRSIIHPTPRPPGGGEARVVIALDPGFAKASFHVAALEPNLFRTLDVRLLENAKAYGSFGTIVDELCMQFHQPGLAVVTHVIVETKAFQKGLMNDEQLIAAQTRWSFDLMPFETGVNKYDPDLGIPQIGPMMDRGLIDFPDFDQLSRDRLAPLYRQMRNWKPGKRGNVLEQDHVMTWWFCVHHWKLWRRTLADGGDNSSQFDFGR